MHRVVDDLAHGVEPTLGRLEGAYRRQALAADVAQAQWVVVVNTIALILASLVDLSVSHFDANSRGRTWLFVAQGLFSGAVVLALPRVRRPRTCDLLLLAWTVGFVLTVLGLQMTNAPVYREAAVVLLTLGSYTLVPNRLAFRIIPAALLTVGDIAILRLQDDPAVRFYDAILAYALAHIAGIWSSAALNTSRRRQYLAKLGEAAAREDLQRLANTDDLTSLLTRRRFLELAEHELSRYRRYGAPFSLLTIDVDFFKRVNDTLGHLAGDGVLRQFAEILTSQSRKSDLVGRLGGEEFCILLPETRLDAASEVARRILEHSRSLRVPSDVGDLRITCSIGVAEATPHDKTIDGLLGRADTALYRAKNNGRNRIELAGIAA